MTAATPLRRLRAAADRFALVERTVDGRRLVARRSTDAPSADAPAVVLVAGLALSGRYLLPAAAELAHRYPVWVPDPPGYGGSEAVDGGVPDIPGLAAGLVRWMDAVDLGSAVLVGNSVGCQIAVEAAVAHPGRVDRLVLQGPTMDAEARTALRQIIRLAANARLEPPSLGPLQAVDWLRTGLPRALLSFRHALAHRLETRLPQVACPALVVRGTRDPVVPERWARRVASLLRHGQLRAVPGASHTMPYTAPLELARLTDGFLARPQAPRA